MTPIDAALTVLVLAAPLNWLVLRHFDQMDDAHYLRRFGVVVTSERALESRSAAIGEFMGRPIPGCVTFRGMAYRFDRVQPARREAIGAGELYLDPGLVYVVL
jgi:hypothetical protein